MIEPIMYFGIGFLVASLIGVVFIPLVHGRAVRLTMRRIEAATPLSMAEIQADKDQLRATEEEFSQRLNALREAERKLSDKEAELAKLSADLDERSVNAESQRIEMVALHTQIEALKNRVSDSERELSVTMKRDTETSWAAERVENALLRERINEIAAEIARLTATLEGPNSPIDQMLAEQVAQSTRAANGSPARGEAGSPSLIPDRTGGNLADRIRALQARAARVPASN